MDKNDIIAKTAEQMGLSQKDAKTTVDVVFGIIAGGLATGEEVSLHGFGKFSVNGRPDRDGRNPRTGETITIKASKTVRFKPAKALKDAL